MTESVKLTWPEINAACQVALFRQLANEARSLEHNYGAKMDFFGGLAAHVRGCIAESATAKALNMNWTGVAGMRAVDVGGMIEVRSIDRETNRLIIHDNDNSEQIAVLAYVEGPTTVHLKGWIEVGDAKDQRFLADPKGGRPAYFIPNDALKPISALRERLGRVA